MSEVTLEKTHALLEKLAEYVMTEVPTKQEMNARFAEVDKRFEQIDKRFEQVDKNFEQIDKRFKQIDSRFEQIDKRFMQIDLRFERIDYKIDSLTNYVLTEVPSIKKGLEEKANKEDMDIILSILDAHSQQLDIIRTELTATNAGLMRHEKRITALEERVK